MTRITPKTRTAGEPSFARLPVNVVASQSCSAGQDARLYGRREAGDTPAATREKRCVFGASAHAGLMMKLPMFVLGLIGAGLVCFAGCKKAEPQQPEGTIQLFGVTVAIPKLDTDFPNPPPGVQTAIRQVKNAYRFGQYGKMIVELDKLANDPALTEPQKKLANDLIEQMKQVLAKAPERAQ
jgi:hypothetical protein